MNSEKLSGDAQWHTPEAPSEADLKKALASAGAHQQGGAPKIVFHPDTRTRVNPTLVYPFSAVGLLTMEFKNGKTYTGTGTLLADNFVLTAAHNLFDENDGGYARNVWFSPAANGSPTSPFEPIAAESFIVSEDYRTSPPPNPNDNGGIVTNVVQYAYDYGLVKLSKKAKDVVKIDMYVASDAEIAKEEPVIAGYPGDKPAATMWQARGKVQPDTVFLFYQISTYKGESGAGLLMEKGDVAPRPYRNVGIHIAGDRDLETNFAVRITEEVQETVERWMRNM